MRCRRLTVGVVFCSLVGSVLTAGALSGPAGCYCPPKPVDTDPNTGQITVRTDDPLSDQIVDDANLPYDRAAALAAIADLDLVEPNLAGYKFSLLFIFQNQFDRDIAFDVLVNFQPIVPRRLVQAGRQEIIVITKDMVRQTEDALRLEPALAGLPNTEDIPIIGKPSPYIAQFKNFVTSDDHVIADQNFLLTPLNAPPFDGTQMEPITKDQPPLRLRPVYECPAIIAFVIEKTRIRTIELDREFSVPDYTADPQEPADPAELLFPPNALIEWLPEQVTVLTYFGRQLLLEAF